VTSLIFIRISSAELRPEEAFGQCRLELLFGAMVFKPRRQARRPPGTDQVLNWAAYGLWEEAKKQDKHLLSEEEELDKKKAQQAAKREYLRKYRATENGKAVRAAWLDKPETKKRKREYTALPTTKYAQSHRPGAVDAMRALASLPR
jgi:hypothetical protein